MSKTKRATNPEKSVFEYKNVSSDISMLYQYDSEMCVVVPKCLIIDIFNTFLSRSNAEFHEGSKNNTKMTVCLIIKLVS